MNCYGSTLYHSIALIITQQHLLFFFSVDKVRRKKLAATLSDVFPRIPTTSKISQYNDDFSEDIWSKIIDMDNVDMDLLLKRKTKSSVKEVTKSSKTDTKPSKKRKAETKSETESDGKMEVKVNVTIGGMQPTLDADCDGRDVQVRLVGRATQASLTALVDRHFFSQESEQPTKKRRTSSRRRS